MAPKNRHMADACAAMKSQGFPEVETKAALKQLLKVYDNKWELIVDGNYSVLVEVILENKNKPEKKKVAQKGKRASIRESNGAKSRNKEAALHDESDLVEPPAKRLCTRGQIKQAIAARESSTSCQERSPLKRVLSQNDSDLEESEDCPLLVRKPRQRCQEEEVLVSGISNRVLCQNDSDAEESVDCPPLVRKPRQRRQEEEVLVSGNSLDPVSLDPVQNCKKQPEKSLNLICAGSSSDFGDYNADVDSMELLEAEPWTVGNQVSLSDSSQLLVPLYPPKGELELSLIGPSFLQSDLCVSNFDQDIEMVEQTSMKSSEIQEYFSEKGTHCTLDENIIFRDVPEFESSSAQGILAIESDYHCNNSCALSFPGVLFVFQNLLKIIAHIPKPILFSHFDALQWLIGIPIKDIESICGETAKRLKAFQSQKCLTLCKVEAWHGRVKCSICIDDIARGEERVEISLEDGRNAEEMPPFYYIPHNLAYKNARVNFSLARISEEGCCAPCSGDCLTSPVPCACATETGGQFAYTPGGLVEEKFLEECISLKREPKQHNYYCSKCPFERSNGEINSVACKGHLSRKFIKECWSKCGCNKNCGNRIVQQGITAKLQVFMTPEGWGLRTLEDLPRGAFVCEYVGEILTNTEVRERNIQSVSKEHTYFPVLLDTEWRSQGIMKDEEALCLDATVFGNVARFINHRCCDATSVEIPVKVETPDRHYYHVALFTTRTVAAMEELTWDYGINLHDSDHGGKAFQCLCGSPLCPDRKDMNLDVPLPLLTYIRRRRRA